MKAKIRKSYATLFTETKLHAYSMPLTSGWQERHFMAWKGLKPGEVYVRTAMKKDFGTIIARTVDLLGDYADSYFYRYDSAIGNDFVLGIHWLDMLKGVRGLLNGEIGSLDGGTVDHLLVEMAFNEGFSEKDL